MSIVVRVNAWKVRSSRIAARVYTDKDKESIQLP